uniref:Uncharacterized protein n=1 Tax=Sphaerodactylus townsendi TaxID=933632 RepID=A0ACB8EVQ3_9SAUR
MVPKRFSFNLNYLPSLTFLFCSSFKLLRAHLQEVLELSEREAAEEESLQEVTLTEVGGSESKEVLEGEQEDLEEPLPHPTVLSLTTTSPVQEEEDGFTYVCPEANYI